MKSAKIWSKESTAQCAGKKLTCKRSCKYGTQKCMNRCKEYYKRCMLEVHAPNPNFHGFRY